MMTQTIHSNLNVGQTGPVASEMKQNHDEMRRDQSTLVDGAANAQNEKGVEER